MESMADTKQFCSSYFDDDGDVEVEDALLGIHTFLKQCGNVSIAPELPAGSDYIDLFEGDDESDDGNNDDGIDDDSGDEG